MTDNTLENRDTNPPTDAGTAAPTRNRTGLWLLLLLAAILLIWYLLSQRAPTPAVVPPDAAMTPVPAESTDTAAAADRGRRADARKPAGASKPKTGKPVAATPRETVPERIAGRSPEPEYPATALRRGEGGEVLLRVNVGSDGVPSEVDFARRSASRDLDRAAQEAVRKWRFTPATRNGKPVPAVVEVPISFQPQA